jgi:hypothetical protein
MTLQIMARMAMSAVRRTDRFVRLSRQIVVTPYVYQGGIRCAVGGLRKFIATLSLRHLPALL